MLMGDDNDVQRVRIFAHGALALENFVAGHARIHQNTCVCTGDYSVIPLGDRWPAPSFEPCS
jgi:hypothetical protein